MHASQGQKRFDERWAELDEELAKIHRGWRSWDRFMAIFVPIYCAIAIAAVVTSIVVVVLVAVLLREGG